MNVVWLILIATSIVTAVITGRLEEITKAIFDGARAAVEVSLFLLGIVSLWLDIRRLLRIQA